MMATLVSLIVWTAQPALALGDDEIIMNSWYGQSIQEVLQVWGLPGLPLQGALTHYAPGNMTTCYYGHERTVFINEKREYVGKSKAGEAMYLVTPAHNEYLSCKVMFMAHRDTQQIYSAKYEGNDCGKYVVPQHISPTWLEKAKAAWQWVNAYETKKTSMGTQVASIRKDTNAYAAGLRKGDYITGITPLEPDTETGTEAEKEQVPTELIVVQRKRGLFSKVFDEYTFTVPPTYHSEAYELMRDYSHQRNQWNVTQ
jgi:arginyl-tRNA--protein-N-Asp/Glu arginylyltransferase